MNNKLLKYILITGVIVVWGTIIYKVLAGTGDTDKPVQLKTEKIAPVAYVKKENFYLFADYPDPFLEEQDSPDTTDLKTSLNHVVPLTAPVPLPVKPDFSYIQYHGMIINADKKNKVGLVSFRGQELLIKEREKREDIRFSKMERDYLVITYKGNNIKILKK